MQDFVNAINDWVWSPALIYLCLLVGLYFSIRGRFLFFFFFFFFIRFLMFFIFIY